MDRLIKEIVEYWEPKVTPECPHNQFCHLIDGKCAMHHLIGTVKDQDTEIEALRDRVAELEAQI